jgi:hypothetical protein
LATKTATTADRGLMAMCLLRVVWFFNFVSLFLYEREIDLHLPETAGMETFPISRG